MMSSTKNKTNAPSQATAEAVDWFVRLQARPLDEREQTRFKAWLAASPRHRQEFDKLDLLWHGAPRLEEVEAHRSAPDRRPFSWHHSEAWRDGVLPMVQHAAAAPATASILNRFAFAVPCFLL